MIYVQLGCFGITVWLGWYVLLASQRWSLLQLVSGLGIWSQAAFWASSVVGYTASSLAQLIAIERWFWWSGVIGPWACLLVGVLLAYDQRLLPRRWLVGAATLSGGGALVLIGLGSLTNVLLDYAHPQQAAGLLSIGPGVAYGLYGFFVAGCGLGMIGLLVWVLRRTSNQALYSPLRLAVVGGLLVVLGAAMLVGRFALPALVRLLAYLLVSAGLLSLTYGLVRLSLTVEGQNVRRDLWRSLTEVAALVGIYALVLGGALSPLAWLGLIGLTVSSHTLLDQVRGLLDRVFLERDERKARVEARTYARVLASQPVALPQQSQSQPTKAFEDSVRRALTGLKQAPRLATSELLTHPLVDARLAALGLHDHRLGRAQALREILVEQIEALRAPAPLLSEVNRFFNVLYYPYVRGVSRSQALYESQRLRQERVRQGGAAQELETVLSWLADLDENTFYKWQRRASDTIALALWDTISASEMNLQA